MRTTKYTIFLDQNLVFKCQLQILAYFPYFKEMEVRLYEHHAVCVTVYPPPSTFECLTQSLRNLIRISWHLSLSHKSVCLHVYPHIVARQRLSKYCDEPLLCNGRFSTDVISMVTNTEENQPMTRNG
jgi:hypothetical protein